MDFYELLKIETTATDEEIKKAYQELARKYHPDKNVEKNEEMFQKIDKAYKTLRDPELRKIYDSERFQRKSAHLIIHENVNRKEFEHDLVEDLYCHRCKCGSYYTIDNDEYCKNENLILSCDECSLNILVT